MEHKNVTQRREEVLYRLNCIPAKMVAAHGCDNLAEFVLYELSHPQCFHLGKVAFFIDNPDFNCLQGIAGVTCDEGFCQTVEPWQEREKFSGHMRQSAFNTAVRSVAHASMIRDPLCEQKLMHVAHGLGFSCPLWHTFVTKHGNHGLVIYEPRDAQEVPFIQQHLPHSVALLAFCPIF